MAGATQGTGVRLMATFRVTGVEQISQNLRHLVQRVPAQAAQALNVVAEECMTDAKERTPVDTGTLKRSGKVHQHATPRRLAAGLSFATEYAVYVHERTELRHATGEAKFLENDIKFTSLFFAERIANEISVFQRGGGTGAGSPGGTGSL